MRKTRIALAALFAALPALASAQEPITPQSCFACHGPEGNSGTPEVPSIAGQPREFLAVQLHLFRDGGRKDAQMAPMSVNLTDKDIEDLATYFSQAKAGAPQKQPDAAVAAAAAPLLERGKCAACHGEALTGQVQAPRLAGQQKAYVAWQLRLFRDGKRAGTDDSMREATKPLSNADMNVLADYVSRLNPP